MHPEQVSEFGKVFLFLILGAVFVLTGYLVNRLISPRKPNPEKLSSYECGEEPAGDAWIRFNVRFYIVALIFLLFDVELIFIFPWATIFAQPYLMAQHPWWGWLSLAEMFTFVGILLLGLVYVWVKGDLDWVKPKQLIPAVNVRIPSELYDRINEEPYNIKPFTPDEPATFDTVSSGALASQVTRPPFRSALKKKE